MPFSNPYAWNAGNRLNGQLVFEGKRLVGLKLFAPCRHGQQVASQSLRSNENGQAEIQLDRPGAWLLRAVLMRPAQSDDADWESFWAALSFGVR